MGMGKLRSQGGRGAGGAALGGILQQATEKVPMVPVKPSAVGQRDPLPKKKRRELQGNTVCIEQLFLTGKSKLLINC